MNGDEIVAPLVVRNMDGTWPSVPTAGVPVWIAAGPDLHISMYQYGTSWSPELIAEHFTGRIDVRAWVPTSNARPTMEAVRAALGDVS